VYLEFEVRRVLCRSCGKVKRERVEFLADNPFYTKRFGYYVGRRCRTATVQDIAKELKLDWHTVKELDKQYMKVQLTKAGKPRPKVIGIDEISIRKGHTYRIVVSDLEKTRPIWFGGQDRSEESLKQFFDELGKPKSARIRLAVMDMWKPFRKATIAHAPQAAILYDKFHVLRQLNEAMDKVRKAEYQRLTNRADRTYIKGQKYVLLSHRENLSPEKRQRLKTLLAANKRLNTAYVLKEQFAQLWEYRRESWARRFFEQWRASLRWQRLQPFEDFAALIERHWEGVAAYCRPENKVALGFVEGLKKLDFAANKQFRIVTVLLDPKETDETARRFRARYLAQYNRPGSEAGWTFLTGSDQNIRALAKAVGFSYNYNEVRGEYIHPAALTLLSPDGKIARYLYGLEYPEKTLRLGVVEASEGRVGSSLDRLVLYCFHYDSSEGRYAPIAARIMQLGGAVSLVVLAGFLTILIRRDKKRALVESTAQ